MWHQLGTNISTRAEYHNRHIPAIPITGKISVKAEAILSNLRVQPRQGQQRCNQTMIEDSSLSAHRTLKTEELGSKLWWHRTRNWRSSKMCSARHPRWNSTTPDSTVNNRERMATNSSPACSIIISLVNPYNPSRSSRYLSLPFKIFQASLCTKLPTRKSRRAEEMEFSSMR